MQRVLLLGRSLFLVGIQMHLRGQGNVDIICVDDDAATLAQTLRERATNAIVFDASVPAPAYLMAVVQEFPNLVLVGVDPSKDSALVLSSRQPVVLNMRELAQVILQE
jgi:hypothetical protein